MSFIIKPASALTSQERQQLGIDGIPLAWPVESYSYTDGDPVPDGFSVVTEEELTALKAANQVAYDAWEAGLPVPEPTPRLPMLVSTNEPKDADGSPLSRVKVTKTGWHFEPRNIYWKTSTTGSMFSKKFDGNTPAGGTDIGDVTVKFYDASGTALTKGAEESDVDYQIRLTANCTKTVMDWHPVHDMEIVGGAMKVVGNEDKNAWGWLIIAPDIPANYGGSVPFLQGGCNIGMFREREFVNFDGRTPKFMAYDPVYKSNKLRVMVLHEVGLAIQVLVRFEIFKA